MTQNNGFLGIGECMVELSGDGDPFFKKGFAGDVLNSLWYMKASVKSPSEVSFFSCVGDDALSDQMLSYISYAGIDSSDIRCIKGQRPGLYIIHLDGTERSFSYWRQNSAARQLAAEPRALKDAIDKASVIYFSGITLAIFPPDDQITLLSALQQAKKVGKLVAFDPNIRPILWPDNDAMKTILTQAAAVSNILLPSFDDEAKAFGDKAPRETIERYSVDDEVIVIVKDGPNDVLSSSSGNLTSFPTPKITNAVDTTGAGDSFNGAFLAEFAHNRDIAAAVRAGQKCAGKVICHAGALVPYEVFSAP